MELSMMTPDGFPLEICLGACSNSGILKLQMHHHIYIGQNKKEQEKRKRGKEEKRKVNYISPELETSLVL